MALPRLAPVACLLATALWVEPVAAQDAGASGSADAAPPSSPSAATLSCVAIAAPGRIGCHLDAQVAPGETIAWGEVVLVEVPDLATALKGRIGPHDATLRTSNAWRWEFALFARARGSGTLRGSARLVVCAERSCLPRVLPFSGEVRVGPSPRDAGRTD